MIAFADCRHRLRLLAGLALATCAAPAGAQTAEEFYRSKSQLQMIVPSAAGGGYDSYARLMGKYLSKYLPGNPTISVANMPGGGGIVAANHMYNLAAKDGTVVAILDRGMPTAPLLYGEHSKAQFDAQKFSWLGSAMSETGMGVVSARAPATTIEEAKKTEVYFGATGPETDPAMYVRLLNELVGTKIKVINGYKGQPDQFLAAEKGEIHGLFMSGWSGPGRAYVREHMAKGEMKILVQMTTKPDPADGDAPTIMDVVKPQDRPIVGLILSRLVLGRPFVAPPGVPADRVELLRAAFRKSLDDPGFQAEAEAQKLALAPTWGAEAHELVQQMYRTPPDLLERVRKIVRVSN